MWQSAPLLDHSTAIENICGATCILVPIISCHDKLWGLARRVFTLFVFVSKLMPWGGAGPLRLIGLSQSSLYAHTPMIEGRKLSLQ